MKIDDIVNGTDAYRSELCKQVQNDSGVECIMLEKDLWVTYVLEKIFADKELSKILRFKGGTSLSKAHRIIRRFSEDVDLVLDWTRFLEIGDPNEERSKTKQAKYNEMMNDARAIATKRMVAEAEALNADAIVNIRYASSAIMQGAAEVIVYGTAVKFVK